MGQADIFNIIKELGGTATLGQIKSMAQKQDIRDIGGPLSKLVAWQDVTVTREGKELVYSINREFTPRSETTETST
jgi:predicted MarR family transcription regulator